MPKPDLLGRRPVVQESSQESKEVVGRLLGGVTKRELRQIPLKSIRIEEQVRREFPEEAHRALMENIRAQGGVIEPVILNRRDGDDRYLLVAGERRLRACRDLAREYEAQGDNEQAEQFAFIPAIIYEELTPAQVQEIQISENLLREDLTDLEETLALCDLLAMRLGVQAAEVPSLLDRLEKEARGERKLSEGHEERLRLVEETFASYSRVAWRTFVKHRLHLLRMPVDVVAAVRSRRLTSAQAELIMRLPDAGMRERMMDRVEREKMPLEELAKAVRAVVEKPVAVQSEAVQVAVRVKKSLTPKRLMALPLESRQRVQELLEEVHRLMDGEGAGG